MNNLTLTPCAIHMAMIAVAKRMIGSMKRSKSARSDGRAYLVCHCLPVVGTPPMAPTPAIVEKIISVHPKKRVGVSYLSPSSSSVHYFVRESTEYSQNYDPTPAKTLSSSNRLVQEEPQEK